MPTVSGFTVVLGDRIRETTQTTGTGAYSTDGAVSGYRTFVSGIGNGNRTCYTAVLGASWEVGIGTVTSGAPATLSRDSILASSNSNNPVSWAAGVKDIFCDVPSALTAQITQNPVASGKVTRFTGSGTFSKDAKSLFVIVELVGGGGGGGAAGNVTLANEVAAGGGGGAGGYSREQIASSILGANVTVTVGPGGAGGTVPTNSGSNGGTTSFGAFLSATGGIGGTGSDGTVAATRGAIGGGGGVGSGGDLNMQGGAGSAGFRFAPVDQGIGGKGGDSYFGGGAEQVTEGAPGNNALANTGAGGSGGCASSTTNRVGGNGGSGIVIVQEFLSP